MNSLTRVATTGTFRKDVPTIRLSEERVASSASRTKYERNSLQQAEESVTNTEHHQIMRALSACFVLISLTVAACGRSASGEAQVLFPGREYEIRLVIMNKPTLTPERAVALGPLQDSVTGILSVDSVVRDSSFGR